MAAPNIVGVTTITGKTAVLAATTVATAIVANPAASGKVFKINALYVSNVDSTNAADITVDLYRSATAYRIASTIAITSDASLDVLTKSLYLEEGDSLRLTSSADGDLQAVCSYEELS
jgi:hypothetical protein